MICRYEHFDKKIQVYDLLVVELFKVQLDIEKAILAPVKYQRPNLYSARINQDGFC